MALSSKQRDRGKLSADRPTGSTARQDAISRSRARAIARSSAALQNVGMSPGAIVARCSDRERVPCVFMGMVEGYSAGMVALYLPLSKSVVQLYPFPLPNELGQEVQCSLVLMFDPPKGFVHEMCGVWRLMRRFGRSIRMAGEVRQVLGHLQDICVEDELHVHGTYGRFVSVDVLDRIREEDIFSS